MLLNVFLIVLADVWRGIQRPDMKKRRLIVGYHHDFFKREMRWNRRTCLRWYQHHLINTTSPLPYHLTPSTTRNRSRRLRVEITTLYDTSVIREVVWHVKHIQSTLSPQHGEKRKNCPASFFPLYYWKVTNCFQWNRSKRFKGWMHC